jgi:hypothetical protein
MRCFRAWVTVSTLLALSHMGAEAAEGGQLLATVEMPAIVTAVSAPASAGIDTRPRVIISVMGFQPPQDGGAVQVVVKAQRDGTEQEVGRFGITPNVPFKAADPSKAQRFGLELPKELASGGPVKLNVYLLPTRGQGRGARLEVGGAEIH